MIAIIWPKFCNHLVKVLQSFGQMIAIIWPNYWTQRCPPASPNYCKRYAKLLDPEPTPKPTQHVTSNTKTRPFRGNPEKTKTTQMQSKSNRIKRNTTSDIISSLFLSVSPDGPSLLGVIFVCLVPLGLKNILANFPP